MAANKTILAVAIGHPQNSQVIRTENPTGVVRPYIKGLIGRLKKSGDLIGDANNYVIDYRECDLAHLNQNFTVKPGLPTSCVILAMSTTVAKAAAQFSSTIDIIAMVSTTTGYGANVCGVSAQRHQRAREYYDHFLNTVPSLQTPGKNIYLLCKDNYAPSDSSRQNILQGQHPVPVALRPVASPWGDTEIQSAINNIPSGSGGLLILPVDHFFGSADNIISWAHARGLPDFWPVTDWVQHNLPSALAGFGVSQERCGQLLADQIHSIWTSGKHIPGQPFTPVRTGSWLASDAAAATLNVTLGNNVPRA